MRGCRSVLCAQLGSPAACTRVRKVGASLAQLGLLTTRHGASALQELLDAAAQQVEASQRLLAEAQQQGSGEQERHRWAPTRELACCLAPGIACEELWRSDFAGGRVYLALGSEQPVAHAHVRFVVQAAERGAGGQGGRGGGARTGRGAPGARSEQPGGPGAANGLLFCINVLKGPAVAAQHFI